MGVFALCLIFGLAWLPGLVVNFLAGPVGPVDDDGQVNQSGSLIWLSPNIRNVALGDLAFFKLHRERALSVFATREDEQPACVHI